MKLADVGLVSATLATIGWAWMLTRIGSDDVYAGLGPYSIVVIATGVALRSRGLVEPARASAPTWKRDVIIGVVVGVSMTIGTYAVYTALEHVVPGFAAHVGSLYRAARAEWLPLAIGWTCVVIVGEEMLFRMWLFDAASMRWSAGAGAAISLIAYVAVQVGSGSWVIGLAALVCGSIWTAERVWTRSWIAPLISHAIWTLTIVHALPVHRV